MRVMPVIGLVLHMRDVDRDPARLLFRRLINVLERLNRDIRVLVMQHLVMAAVNVVLP